MKMSRPKSTDFCQVPYFKEIVDIPKQHMHIPKVYNKSSPIRNKENMLKTRSKNLSPVQPISLNNVNKSAVLERYYKKIFTNINPNTESGSIRHFSIKRKHILENLSDKTGLFSRDEQEEAVKNYKITRNRIGTLLKHRIPTDSLRYRQRLLMDSYS
jgi:hypothetical protein